jgi:hypothetical protein
MIIQAFGFMLIHLRFYIKHIIKRLKGDTFIRKKYTFIINLDLEVSSLSRKKKADSKLDMHEGKG